MLRHFPNGRTVRLRVALGAVLTASLIAATIALPGAGSASPGSHSLSHRRSALGSRIAHSHANLDDISRRLLAAQGSLETARNDLDAARTRLTQVRGDVRGATRRDQRMAAALEQAQQRLRDAKLDLRRGQHTVATQRAMVAGYAVSNGPTEASQLSTLGLLFSSRSTQQALDRIQANESAIDAQLSDLQRLQANQALLRYTEQRVRQDTTRVAAARAAAAEHLATTRVLEADAASAESAVRQRVAALQRRRDALAAAKAAERARIATMERERAAVEARLHRIAARRAAERSSAAGLGVGAALASADGGYLSYPVENTYITSPYGMRLHPILHIWELHDGTDFHAPCGTPVHAAADGTVTSEYYNVGYGNRLMLDNGFVHGVSLWTSYNHLTSYVAHVGEHVSRGQLIAYSGTTGWSTGCHLHFMVYVNGHTVNPVTWL